MCFENSIIPIPSCTPLPPTPLPLLAHPEGEPGDGEVGLLRHRQPPDLHLPAPRAPRGGPRATPSPRHNPPPPGGFRFRTGQHRRNTYDAYVSPCPSFAKARVPTKTSTRNGSNWNPLAVRYLWEYPHGALGGRVGPLAPGAVGPLPAAAAPQRPPRRQRRQPPANTPPPPPPTTRPPPQTPSSPLVIEAFGVGLYSGYVSVDGVSSLNHPQRACNPPARNMGGRATGWARPS